jgi:hypothetical protein
MIRMGIGGHLLIVPARRDARRPWSAAVPSSISPLRRSKAFDEGRRSATSEAAQNPYDNPKLRQLWEDGRAKQRSGELTTPIPPLEHGATRARRAQQNPPGSSRPRPPAPRPRGGPGGFGGFRPRGR